MMCLIIVWFYCLANVKMVFSDCLPVITSEILLQIILEAATIEERVQLQNVF